MKKAILNEYALNGYTVNSNAPIGAIMIWMTSTAPAGWVLCNHTKLSISDYPELYEKVKDIPQCQSEEEGFFYTPDFRDRVPQGANGNLGQLIEAGLPNAKGVFSSVYSSVSVQPSGIVKQTEELTGRFNSGSAGHIEQLEIDLSRNGADNIYGNSDTVQPPANACNFIIKAIHSANLEQNAIDDSKATTGNVWSASKVSEEIGKLFTTWENITDDCIISFGGASGGSTKTDYVIYNPYLKKYRYKGTFNIGHETDRKIKIEDTKNRADMSKSYVTGNMNGITRASAGLEFTTNNKTSNSVLAEFYNRNSSQNWDTCELSFEVDCSYTD